MPEPRLQATGRDSFFGDYLDERVFPQHRSLRLLRGRFPASSTAMA